MGISDLIPGISGGSIALTLGIYERFLSAIKKMFDRKSIYLFFTFHWKEYLDRIDGLFLVPLICGIGSAIAIFSHILIFFFSDPIYHLILLSFFFGGMVAVISQMGKEIIKAKSFDPTMILLGAVFALIFISFPRQETTELLTTSMSAISANQGSLGGTIISHLSIVQPVMIIVGVLAVSAMLLPGISGSYVLFLFGVYSKVLLSLTVFISALKSGVFDADSFIVISNLSLGCLIGAALFSRIILWALQKYRASVFSFLLGLMVGSIKVLWPFSHTTLTMHLFSFLFFFSSCFFCLGFYLVWKLKKEKLVCVSE